MHQENVTNSISHKTSFIDIILEHRSKLIALLIVIIASLSLISGFYSYTDSKNKKASAALFKAIEEFNKDKSEASITKLEKLIQEHNGTVAAFEAQLKIADHFFASGNYEKAQPAYQLASKQASNNLFKTLALQGLGASFENQKKYKEAAEVYHEALRVGEKSLKAELLIAKGRTLLLSGDKAKSKESLEQVIKEYTGTEYSSIAQRMISQI